jgi:hypothetical protein
MKGKGRRMSKQGRILKAGRILNLEDIPKGIILLHCPRKPAIFPVNNPKPSQST